MTLFFILALILLIPTSGLSLLIWIVAAIWRSVAAARARERARVTSDLLDRWFPADLAEFWYSLDPDSDIPYDLAEQRAGLIKRYIAHNPSETLAFLEAMKGGNSNRPPHDQLDAAELLMPPRRSLPEMSLHMISLRAITALQKNNPDLAAMRDIGPGVFLPRLSSS